MTWGKNQAEDRTKKDKESAADKSKKKEKGGPASCKLSCNAKNKQDTELNVPIGP